MEEETAPHDQVPEEFAADPESQLSAEETNTETEE